MYTEGKREGPQYDEEEMAGSFNKYIYMYFNILFYLLLEKGREKERKKNVHVWLPLVRPQLGKTSLRQFLVYGE